MAELLSPENFVASDKNGNEKTFIISDIPAIPSREIAALYLPSAIPKIGDYAVNKQMMLKMMGYVSVLTQDGQSIRLSTEALIDNHTDFVQLAKIERAMIEKNFGFFLEGTISRFSDTLKQIVPQLTSLISMASLAQSSQKKEQPLTNSEPSIA